MLETLRSVSVTAVCLHSNLLLKQLFLWWFFNISVYQYSSTIWSGISAFQSIRGVSASQAESKAAVVWWNSLESRQSAVVMLAQN